MKWFYLKCKKHPKVALSSIIATQAMYIADPIIAEQFIGVLIGFLTAIMGIRWFITGKLL